LVAFRETMARRADNSVKRLVVMAQLMSGLGFFLSKTIEISRNLRSFK
jgi:hypothetical protein